MKSTLSTEAQALQKRICSEYAINDCAGQHLLQTALEAFDRMRQAQALIDEHGLCILDRFGTLKPNPAAVIERDSRAAMLGAIKQLNLDIQPLAAVGRPPRI